MEDKFFNNDTFSIEEATDAIKKAQSLLLLENSSLECIAKTGQFYVMDIDDKYIVRFPKENTVKNGVSQSLEELRFESDITENISSYVLKTKISKISVVDGEYPFAYHEKIKGSKLKKDEYNSLTTEQKKRYAEDIASFLAELHGVPLDSVSVPNKENLNFMRENTDKIQETLEKYGISLIEQKREDEDEGIVCCHNDLHQGNIGVDLSKEHILQGVFDFGMCGANVRSADFYKIYDFDKNLCKNVVDEYNKISPEKVSLENVENQFLSWCAVNIMEAEGTSPMVVLAVEEKLQKYKMDKDKEFEDIVSSVSLEDMMKPYERLSRREIEENNKKNLSVEEQKFYLAYYARMATEHVGFEQFSKENQEAFKSHIVRMYRGIDGERNQGELLEEMGESAKFIEDRHFEIGIGKSEAARGGGENRDRTVGKNFCYRTDDERPKGYEKLGGASMVTESGEHVPTWEIGTLKKNGEDILVVSVFDIMHRGNDYEEWKDFIEKFDEVYEKDKEKWEKGRIILDVRGNRGGEDKPIDHMAKRLYGNLVNTYKRCEVKDSSLGYHLYQQHGSVKNAKKLGQEPPKREHFSGKNKALFDETGVYYAFNEEKGYKGRIDILTCARVGSSAESAYSSFYHHPNVRYIGENTAGMQQYVQGTFATPWGGEMRVGWGKLTYWDKEGENIEVKGHKPDVECKGKDAFDVALVIPRDYGRVVGFRELNEEVKGEIVIKDYDPKLVSDPSRKAYYSLQTFPAMAKLEGENRRVMEVQNAMGRVSDIINKKKENEVIKPKEPLQKEVKSKRAMGAQNVMGVVSDMMNRKNGNDVTLG